MAINKIKIGPLIALAVVLILFLTLTKTIDMGEIVFTLIKWVIIVAVFVVVLRFVASKFKKKEESK